MNGIALAGHWVLDRIKFIDNWPKQAELCNIVAEETCNGGAPFNVIIDMANLKVPFPTYGIGCIGDDDMGRQILAMCHEKHINIDLLQILPNEVASYSDIMTVRDTGARTIFHYHGANRKFAPHHVPLNRLKELQIKIFYLGHLLLMDALEEPDHEYGHICARLLHDIQKLGIETAVDIATESSHRYQKIVVPALPYIDHFIVNELEAGKTVNINTRDEKNNLLMDNVKKAAHQLLDLGVKKNVIIHMPEGSFWLDRNREEVFHPSLHIPKEKFIATCGAGDAFCSGVLVGLHEGWNKTETLKLATATAAASITSAHNSNGIMPIAETMKLNDAWA